VPNVKLIVEYDGHGFHGWQKQGDLRTIQSELERAITIILRQPIGPLHASGRTDAGVHARGQVVTFKTESVPDLWKIRHGVSHLLKGELAVVSAEIVADSFHPGRCATHKQYSYTILNRPAPAVLDARRVWHVTHELDIECMRRCAAVLVGTHDFTSFRDSDCTAKFPVKTIYSSEVVVNGDTVTYRVVGSGFLKQMVRNITGTLVDFGRGRMRRLSMEEILAARDRRTAGITAPAHGLCLDWVSYDAAPLLSAASGEGSVDGDEEL
jgi:tRNA pseudouridine38-40 synthase